MSLAEQRRELNRLKSLGRPEYFGHAISRLEKELQDANYQEEECQADVGKEVDEEEASEEERDQRSQPLFDSKRKRFTGGADVSPEA